MASGNGDVIIEHVFNASPESIWAAWTEPAQIMQWFGSDPQGKVLKAELDVREGGQFEISFADSNLTEHTCSGIYKKIEKNQQLSFSWTWKNEPGVTSFVEIWLLPNGNTTTMKFMHSGVGHLSAHNYEQGWRDTFLKIERVLSANKSNN